MDRERVKWLSDDEERRGLEKRLCQTKSFGHTIKEEKRKNGVLNEKEAV